jgi:hypothetical protein
MAAPSPGEGLPPQGCQACRILPLRSHPAPPHPSKVVRALLPVDSLLTCCFTPLLLHTMPLIRNNFTFDNRWVVPFNPYLSLRYSCHINVEICAYIKAIKYLHKYGERGAQRRSLLCLLPAGMLCLRLVLPHRRHVEGINRITLLSSHRLLCNPQCSRGMIACSWPLRRRNAALRPAPQRPRQRALPPQQLPAVLALLQTPRLEHHKQQEQQQQQGPNRVMRFTNIRTADT